jgi:integrase
MPTESLTAASVARLAKTPPAAGRVEIWDAKIPGLCLRVSAGGAASWSYRYRPRNGGGHQRITLGSLAALGLADARERAARHRVEVADGGDPQRQRRDKRAAAASVLTFDRLAQRYLDEYAKQRKSSWRNDAGYLKRPRKSWGERDPRTISRRDAILLLDEIKADAPVSANRTQSVLVTLFNWAVEDGLLEINQLAGLRKRAKEQAKERVLSDSEIRVLWHAVDGAATGTSGDITAALKALLLTGVRPGEAAGAVQSELVALDDPNNARWEIPAARMKARRPHVVPLAPLARALFLETVARRRKQEDGEGVFASRFLSRTTLARHSLSQALGRIILQVRPKGPDADAVRTLQRAPPTPHDLRRSVATQLAVLGIAREDRLAVLAHAPSDVHGTVYDKYERLREKRIALATWERHLAKLLGEPELSAAVVPMRRGQP